MIDDYERLGVVAQTATTTVWKAFDPALKRPVALKQVTRPDAADTTLREAAVLARLRHPNIVSVHDIFDEDSTVWLVEQWVNGASLSAVLTRTGRLRAIDAFALIHGALQGLSYAHDMDVVHGDVTPANILIDDTGTPMLVDFGLAASADATSVGGTPGYMAPETAGGTPFDKCSDVYSSCVVLTELLKGARLFPQSALTAARQQTEVPELDGIERPIAAVLQTGLDPNPEARPTDGKTLLAQLEAAIEETHGRGWLALAGLGAIGSTAATISAGVTLTGTTVAAETPGATAASSGRSLLTRGKLIAAGATVAAVIAAVAAFFVLRPGPPRETASEQSQTTTIISPPGAAPAAAAAAGPWWRGSYGSTQGPDRVTVTSDCPRCDANFLALGGAGLMRWNGAGWQGTISFMCGPYVLTATPTEVVDGTVHALSYTTTATGCSPAAGGTLTRMGD
jgi:eukaryotic-like serine/threonine-protein kinase